GAIDRAFGQNGYATVDFQSDIDEANALVIQPDGKIVVVGSVSRPQMNFALVRLNADGSPDPSFGTAGLVEADQVPGKSDVAMAVALQPDGKLIVVGDAGNQWVVSRCNADGTPDSTFGTGGRVLTDVIGALTMSARAVTLQSSGKILVGGAVNTTGG